MAKDAEKHRRRELEEGFHHLGNAGEQRIRPLKEIIDEYLVGYVFRNRAPRFPLATAGVAEPAWSSLAASSAVGGTV